MGSGRGGAMARQTGGLGLHDSLDRHHCPGTMDRLFRGRTFPEIEMNHLLPHSFFQWCANTSIARAISGSMWGFAVLETVHILGLAVLLGCIFVVNLAVLGFGMGRPAARLARDLAPWALVGFLVMVCSGVP